MSKIGNMVWRVGELIEFDQQLAWNRAAGFDGIGFHASAGVAGEWCGLEPSTCDATERARLRAEIGQFAFSEIHAPFAIELRTETLSAGLAALAPVLELAKDLGVGVVTVHAQLPHPDASSDLSRWSVPMQALNARAARARTTVALEIADAFDVVKDWKLPYVGVTLDVGHMYSCVHRRILARFGGIGSLVRHLGPTLVHLHVHDVAADGYLDHIEVGTGIVQFNTLFSVLREIGYGHNMTLELNPDRVSPEGIRRSAVYLRECLRRATAG